MPDIFTCRQGHRWEVCSGAAAPPIPPGTCPKCGEKGELLVAPGRPPGDFHDDDKTLAPSLTPPEPPTIDAATLALRLAPDASSAAKPSEVSGYEILNELGRGGMGVVYKARQKGLKRLVALKMILGGAHAGSEQVARFRAEAEAVARLQHAHIVQIYEVGEAEGFPFFSLEFVEGGSLADKLDGTPQAPRAAAQMVQILADAMHYAHQHGIVHRDLKPANILLAGVPDSTISNLDRLEATTKYGLPKITDFGLAKPMEGDSGLTKAGAILGTPSYMAPEQADNKDVGPAADTYALGSILYELLTGRPPFRAGTPLDTILQLINEEPVPPGRLTSNLPADLETICLKCLEKDPRKRYASAQALAEDLRRFIGNEPILARPTGPIQRALKWAKRRPAVAGLVGVSALGLLILAGVITFSAIRLKAERDFALEQKKVADTERDAAQQARDEAEKQRLRAQTSFERARDAVDQMLTRVGDQKLKNVPLLQELQRELLEEALNFNKQFLQDSSGDPAVRRETGRAYYRAGGIRALLGQHEEAIAAFRGAIKLQQELIAEEPDARRDLALSYEGLGGRLADLQRYKEADEAFATAGAQLQALLTLKPDDPGYRRELGLVYSRQGFLLGQMRRWEEIEAFYRKALAVQDKLVAEFPKAAMYRNDRALTHGNLAIFLITLRRTDEAEQAYRKAIEAQEALLAEFPKELAYREELIRSQSNLAGLYGEHNRLKDAEQTFRKTILAQTALVADFPRVPAYRRSLAMTCMNLGITLDMSGRKQDALAPYRQALAYYEGLVGEFPKLPGYRQELAGCLNNLAAVTTDTGNKEEAEKLYRRSLTLVEGLLVEFPNDRSYHHEVGRVQGNLARLIAPRDLKEAHRLIEQAIDHIETALRARPGHNIYIRMLRGHYVTLAEILLTQGDFEAAAQTAAKLPPLAPQSWEVYYDMACLLSRCVPVIGNSKRLPQARRRELTESYAARALTQLRLAKDRGFKNADDLKKDPDLDALRTHDEFRKLIVELEKTAKP